MEKIVYILLIVVASIANIHSKENIPFRPIRNNQDFYEYSSQLNSLPISRPPQSSYPPRSYQSPFAHPSSSRYPSPSAYPSSSRYPSSLSYPSQSNYPSSSSYLLQSNDPSSSSYPPRFSYPSSSSFPSSLSYPARADSPSRSPSSYTSPSRYQSIPGYVQHPQELPIYAPTQTPFNARYPSGQIRPNFRGSYIQSQPQAEAESNEMLVIPTCFLPPTSNSYNRPPRNDLFQRDAGAERSLNDEGASDGTSEEPSTLIPEEETKDEIAGGKKDGEEKVEE